MARSLWNGVCAERVKRLDVVFQLPSGVSMNGLLGRTAHLQFLESEGFALSLIANCQGAFET